MASSEMKNLVALSLLLLTACSAKVSLHAEYKSVTEKVATELPTNVTNVQDVGNGWVTFTFNRQCFLYYSKAQDTFDSLDRAVTKIDCEEKPSLASTKETSLDF
jgi:hypothetical protein